MCADFGRLIGSGGVSGATEYDGVSIVFDLRIGGAATGKLTGLGEEGLSFC